MKPTNAATYYAKTRVPHADIRRMPGKRTYDEYVTFCGREIGSKHQILDARGNVTSETYYINN